MLSGASQDGDFGSVIELLATDVFEFTTDVPVSVAFVWGPVAPWCSILFSDRATPVAVSAVPAHHRCRRRSSR